MAGVRASGTNVAIVVQDLTQRRDMVRKPISKLDDDAFTRLRIILMNGIENEAAIFSHAFARASDDPDLLRRSQALETEAHRALTAMQFHDQLAHRIYCRHRRLLKV